jgi:hypothetical protein
MEAIINFIKEALAGKKMSAEWIVTLGVAIGGIVWAGTLAMQMYDTTMTTITELKELSHPEVLVIPYDDIWIRELSENNMNRVIALEVEVKNLEKNQDRTDRTVNSNSNPLSL